MPSDAAEAMEVGADAVLVNTAIAVAGDPVAMARAFALATEAGRLGLPRRPRRGRATTAEASSPLTGFLLVSAPSRALRPRTWPRQPVVPSDGTTDADVDAALAGSPTLADLAALLSPAAAAAARGAGPGAPAR